MKKQKKIKKNYLQKRHKVEYEEWLDKEYLRQANNYPCEQSTGGCWEDGIWYPYSGEYKPLNKSYEKTK